MSTTASGWRKQSSSSISFFIPRICTPNRPARAASRCVLIRMLRLPACLRTGPNRVYSARASGAPVPEVTELG